MASRDTVAGINPAAPVEMVKERAFELLKKIRSVALATINGTEPAVLIVSISAIKDNRIYLLVHRGKPLFDQLKEKPFIAIVGMTPDFIVVRVKGPIQFMGDRTFLENLIVNKAGMYTEKTDILESCFSCRKERGKSLTCHQDSP